MKIGLNLLLYTTQPDESILPTAERLKEIGFDGLEWPIFGTDKKRAEKFRAFNERTGLEATTVFVFGDPAQSPISPDESARKAAMATLVDRIEVCAALGSRMLVGPITQPLGHFTGTGPTAQEWSRCVEFFKEAGDHAAKNDVTIVLEYLNRFEIYFLNTAADAARLCRQIGHPYVKTMIDSFHANIEEKNLRDAVLAARDQLVHVHISENDRGIPGSSKCIQWADLFGALGEIGYDGWYMIESFSQALPDLAAAAKIWRKLFDDPEDVGRQGYAFIRKMLG